MIQAGGTQKPSVAYRLLQPDTPGVRLPRGIQSASADALLRELRAQDGALSGPSSKAHSRALVAAAVGKKGVLGLDVEFHAPGRPIEAIARYLMGMSPANAEAAYRVFTFYEAYFKATGAFPSAAAMRAIAEIEESECVIDGLRVHHCTIERGFTMALAWGDAP